MRASAAPSAGDSPAGQERTGQERAGQEETGQERSGQQGQRSGSLTVAQAAALSIGAVLGTGVIGLPALGAQTAGPASLVAWLALVLLSVPLAATFAALGARYPDSGGVATYARRAFGSRAAIVVGWSFYFAAPVGAPAAGMFAGAYVAAAFGGGAATTIGTAAALILIVAVANFWGVRISGKVQLVLSGLLIAMLVTATVTALPHADPANLQPFAPYGWGSVAVAAGVLVWGFVGWEAVTSLAGELRRPARDVPRATMIALVVISVLYLAVAAASVLVLGAWTGATEAPLAELLAIGVGGQTRVFTAFAAVLLTMGTLNAYYAAAAKLGSALGRDGSLPAWFAPGSESGGVPRRSLAVFAGISAVAFLPVLIADAGTRTLVLLTTGSLVLVYVIGMAAALRLLPPRTFARRAAGLGFAAVLALYLVIGPYALWSLAVGLAALAYDGWRRRSGATNT
ncbi:MAG TPA: APC family permease [Micromonosporaceae bacterium]|nr:APC family permease [Micromonosporaceae bacterium]